MPHVVVIGGGIAGLAAALRLAEEAPAGRPLAVTLLEAAPRLGGKVATEHAGGFLVERGPDSFVTRNPAALELVRSLGLAGRLLAPRPETDRVYVVAGGRLVPLPAGMAFVVPTRLGPVMRSPLLSWRGKARLALELVLPPGFGKEPDGSDGGDESVGAFLRRRFGREAVDALAGPMLAGIHSTPIDELSLQAAFPRLAALERRRGSLVRGLRRARRRPPAAPGSGRPLPGRMSLAGGLGELVEAAEARLRAAAPAVRLATSRAAVALAPREGGGFEVVAAGGERLAADAVVLACPAAAAGRLLAGWAPAPAAALAGWPHASSTVVALGYRSADLARPLDGYGFLAPRREGLATSACTWSSAKLAGRAPAGHELVRVFFGDGEPAEGADPVARAHAELAALLGVAAPPVLVRVERYPGANPRYRVGHAGRVAAVAAALPPGLLLAGSAYHGIGLPDCVASGRQAAEAALAAAAARSAARPREPAAAGRRRAVAAAGGAFG